MDFAIEIGLRPKPTPHQSLGCDAGAGFTELRREAAAALPCGHSCVLGQCRFRLGVP